MKKILIALDYNPAAEKVAQMGYQLARSMRAEVRICHIITDPAYYAIEYSPIMGYQGMYTDNTVAMVDNIKEEAEKFLASAVRHLDDSNIKAIVLEGETADSILEYSKDWGADLIVMGSHVHKGLEGLLVSDMAAQVLKHSSIPLLAIPTEQV